MSADAATAEALREIARRRKTGARIVFTNGCFDLLHPGHVDGLRRARELGDALVVAVNSDASVRRLKGAGRPILPLGGRLEMLRALRCVDWAIPFDAASPTELIRELRPAVYVKGSDWRDRTLPEAEVTAAVGAEVAYIDLLAGFSTTALVERIRAIPLEPANEGDPGH